MPQKYLVTKATIALAFRSVASFRKVTSFPLQLQNVPSQDAVGLPTRPSQRNTKTLSNNDLRSAHYFPQANAHSHHQNNRSQLHYDLGRIPGGSKTKSCSTLDIRSQLARDMAADAAAAGHVYSNVLADEEREIYRRNLELKAKAYMARGRSIGELRTDVGVADGVWKRQNPAQGSVAQSRSGTVGRRSRLIENDTLY